MGATACASGSQEWKGTAAAFTSRPVVTRTNAASTSASGGPAPSARPIWAKPSSPVRAYSSVMPSSMQYAPREFTTPKASAPWSGFGSSTRKRHSATSAAAGTRTTAADSLWIPSGASWIRFMPRGPCGARARAHLEA